MDFLGDVLAWLVDPANYSGRDAIPKRVGEHLWVSVCGVVVAAALATPPAAWLAHRRRGAFLTGALVNVGRAVPSFGIVIVAGVLFAGWGLGMAFWPTFVALVALALPPIFTNVYTGVRGVDPAAVESARGMGMTERQILLRTELPLASAVIFAGLRIATAQVIATATIGAVLTFGGLGRYIIDGFAQKDEVKVFAGAILVALLTLLSEGVFALLERVALPAGVRRVVRTADVADTAAPA